MFISIVVETFPALALYDSGANVSIINYNFIRQHNIKFREYRALTYKTMSGAKSFIGIASLQVQVFNMIKRIHLFVINDDSFHYDVLLGLDSIKIFRLQQDHQLCVTQYLKDSETNILSSFPNWFVSADFVNQADAIPNSSTTLPICHNTMIFDDIDSQLSHLDTFKKTALRKMLISVASVFAKDRYDVGSYTENEAHIHLSQNKIIARKPYKCSFQDQKEISRQVSALLKANLISESSSPYAAPVTMAFKKSEGERNRMCIDFRGLNKLIVPEPYPFPTIDDIIVKTACCTWFSALDINSAFWSIPIRKKDRFKTAFITLDGHLEWNCLPFGIKTASSVYQRILSGVLRKHSLTSFCVNYIDDILVFSRSFEEHLDHLKSIFKAICSEGFKFKLAKCSFASPSVRYLGHILDANGIRPLMDNIISIKNFPVPTSKKNVRQFLGKANFYHKFFEQSAILLEPLHRLLRKDTTFEWSSECQKSFDTVKNILSAEPVLAVFDRKKPIFLYTDASLLGIGAILKQPQEDGSVKPTAYFSKKLSEAQKKKTAVFLECLAIKQAIKYWQYLLMGNHFTVFSDHKPLEDLRVSVRTDEELGDMINYLSQFDFNIVYNPGPQNLEADCLSRKPVLEHDSPQNKDIVRTVNFLSVSEILNDQSSIILKPSDFQIDKITYRELRGKRKIVLSNACARRLVDSVHQHFGHIGSAGLINLISPYVYSEGLFSIIREKSCECHICIHNKSRRPRSFGLLGHLGPPTRPFEIVSLDTIGGFDSGSSAKCYLHLLVDHFTRFVFISTSRTQNSTDFIKLIQSVHSKHPISTLLTDQIGGLSSNEFHQVLDSHNIKYIFTAVDAAFSNGLNERLNQSLTNRIRCRYNQEDSQRNWTSIANQCVTEYNSTPHSATGFAPNYLLYGVRSPIFPEHLLTPSNLTEDRKLAFDSSLHNHNTNKKRYDRLRQDIEFLPGDFVFVENGNKLNRSKLDPIRIGPFPISEKISKSIYRIKTSDSFQGNRLFHISKLVPLSPTSVP